MENISLSSDSQNELDIYYNDGGLNIFKPMKTENSVTDQEGQGNQIDASLEASLSALFGGLMVGSHAAEFQDLVKKYGFSPLSPDGFKSAEERNVWHERLASESI